MYVYNEVKKHTLYSIYKTFGKGILKIMESFIKIVGPVQYVERRTKDSESRTTSKSETPAESQTPQSPETHNKSPASQSKTPAKSQTPESETSKSQTLPSIQSASLQSGAPQPSTPAPHPGCPAQLPTGGAAAVEHHWHITCRDGLNGKRNRVRCRKAAADW